ncbi:hypothetical protein [Mycobacterium sp. Aquia_213]|uniref:hypothetical protein n=1 Tax=Mycobacterium sp. Aquia_213 TaxID=2991728 RepID=UPI002271AF0C|nr:hypothetical protein [Mycobacterium sp. Aquia_213]WAC91192.1 hypothetical protein LMQ14_25535 [Mycobacterium sp. Aquia_213]
MTDLAVGARQPTVNKPISPERSSTARRLSAGSSARNIVGRQIPRWVVQTATAVRAAVISPRRRDRPSEPHYHRRERFVEDAAMSREMFRL